MADQLPSTPKDRILCAIGKKCLNLDLKPTHRFFVWVLDEDISKVYQEFDRLDLVRLEDIHKMMEKYVGKNVFAFDIRGNFYETLHKYAYDLYAPYRYFGGLWVDKEVTLPSDLLEKLISKIERGEFLIDQTFMRTDAISNYFEVLMY